MRQNRLHHAPPQFKADPRNDSGGETEVPADCRGTLARRKIFLSCLAPMCMGGCFLRLDSCASEPSTRMTQKHRCLSFGGGAMSTCIGRAAGLSSSTPGPAWCSDGSTTGTTNLHEARLKGTQPYTNFAIGIWMVLQELLQLATQ